MDLVQHQMVKEIKVENFCLFAFDDEEKWGCEEKIKNTSTFDVEDLDENTFGTRSIFFQTNFKNLRDF